MINIEKLGRLLGEEVINNAGICFYPGRFKPPHKGHFKVVQDLRSRSYIQQIIILISKLEVEGISAEKSKKIWDIFLQAQPIPNVSVKIATTDSPIADIVNYLKANPQAKTVYVVGGSDESDDLGYLQNLSDNYKNRVYPIQVEEKDGDISAPYVRDVLEKGNYDEFERSLPEAVIQKGGAPEIYTMLTGKTPPTPITENLDTIETPSIIPHIDTFVEWCCKMLQIDNIPTLNFITDYEFTRNYHSFGGYNPSENAIDLVIVKRNLADILRTLGHELVHCKQNENQTLSLEDGVTGSDIENEANAVAGMIMREYGKRNPTIYEEPILEGAPGTFKAKITRTYGGNATIEKAKKFKARKNATTLDKKQANWFINMHSK